MSSARKRIIEFQTPFPWAITNLVRFPPKTINHGGSKVQQHEANFFTRLIFANKGVLEPFS